MGLAQCHKAEDRHGPGRGESFCLRGHCGGRKSAREVKLADISCKNYYLAGVREHSGQGKLAWGWSGNRVVILVEVRWSGCCWGCMARDSQLGATLAEVSLSGGG